MKKKIELEIDYSSHTEVTITNSNGDTFSFELNSRNEGLVDFLHGAKSLPIDSVSNSFFCYDALIDEAQGDPLKRCDKQCDSPKCK